MIFELGKERLQRVLSAMLQAASADDSRITLYMVQWWQQGDKLCASASDGHWAAVWTEVVDVKDTVERFGITRSDAEFLAGVLDLDKTTETLEVQLYPSFEVSCARWSIRIARMLGGPDIEPLVRSTERGAIPFIGINPEILADVRKAFRLGGRLERGAEGLEFGFGPTPLSPILVTCPRVSELACIVMPMRVLDVEARVDGEIRRYINKDTGEVVYSEQVSKQRTVPGCEVSPVEESREALQSLVDKMGESVSITVEGSNAPPVKLEPRKRGKKKTDCEEVSDAS